MKTIQKYNKIFVINDFIDINDDLQITGDNVINKNLNSKYVFDENEHINNTFSYSDFTDNDIIILQSCTGTGKTTAISSHIKTHFEEQPDSKLLCITPIKSLVQQLPLNFLVSIKLRQGAIKKTRNYLRLVLLLFVLILSYHSKICRSRI